MTKFRYVYGPVKSWRLGRSLGIDLLSNTEKICNFNCIYCQLGETKNYVGTRQIYVSTEDLIKELNSLPKLKFDCVTFSGMGEPTLAKNIGETITAIKALLNKPVIILTNSSLLGEEDVINDLKDADFIIAKLDAYSNESLKILNNPINGLGFEKIFSGIKKFRKRFKGKFGLQLMFVELNKNDSDQLARLSAEIDPDEIQLNTPLRPSPVKPLNKNEISEIRKKFNDFNTIAIYFNEKRARGLKSLDSPEVFRRRGVYS